MKMNTTINNVIALLEECIANGEKNPGSLYGWFLSEYITIKNAIDDLVYLDESLED